MCVGGGRLVIGIGQSWTVIIGEQVTEENLGSMAQRKLERAEVRQW